MFQIKKISADNSTAPLLLDAGNVLFKQQTVTFSQELVTAAGLIDLYRLMNYDAVAIGPNDLAAGLCFLQERSGKDFPWVSANLLDSHNQPLFAPSRICTKGGIQIGIIGLTGPIPGISQSMIVADWQKALSKQIEALSPRCAMLIVLSSLSDEDNLKLVNTYKKVQLLVTTSSQKGTDPPQQIHATMIGQTLTQGKNLGHIAYPIQSEHAPPVLLPPAEPRTAPIVLTQELPEDREIANEVESLKKRITQNNLNFIENQKNTGQKKETPELAGINRCESCHQTQVQFWKGTHHARAYITLRDKHQHLNLDCLPCHLTLLPTDGQNRYSAEELLGAPSELQTVGCESCHGPRARHAEAKEQIGKSTGEIKEGLCRQCHTAERDPFFNFQQKIAKVRCPKS